MRYQGKNKRRGRGDRKRKRKRKERRKRGTEAEREENSGTVTGWRLLTVTVVDSELITWSSSTAHAHS